MKSLQIGMVILVSGCTHYQGTARFAQARVPVVFGSRDAIGEAHASQAMHRRVGELSEKIGEGSGAYRVGNMTTNWSWSRSTAVLDQAVSKQTAGRKLAAIRNLRIEADTRTGLGSELVIINVYGDVEDIVAPTWVYVPVGQPPPSAGQPPPSAE